MEEQEEPDTVCLREGMEETDGEERAGRSSGQLTPETQTDREVNMYIVYGTHLSSWCMGPDPGFLGFLLNLDTDPVPGFS